VSNLQSANIVDKLPNHSTKQYGKRDVTELKFIAVHHSATEGGDPFSFARYHIETNNWPGMGYHYVIMPDGFTYKTNNITTVSFHVKDNNPVAVGICLVGNFDIANPTQEQYNSLAELCRLLLQEYPWLKIKGHKDLQEQRTCPGKNFDFLYLHTLLRNRPTYEDLEKENAELKERLRQIKKIAEV